MPVPASTIEWTQSTWGPVRGCSRVSAGCDSCYAIRTARRFDHPGGTYEGLTRLRKKGQLDWSGVVREVPEAMDAPLHWRRPRRIFVASMSDPFHAKVPDATLVRIWDVMRRCPQHQFQLLTKRPERMADWVHKLGVVLPHVWLGVSCEDQATANERIPLLLDTPARIRWVSAEPLLGPINLIDAQMFWLANHIEDVAARGVDWIVLGGESGPHARPCEIAWLRSLLNQCAGERVPAFVKQLGRYPVIPAADPAVRGPSILSADVALMREWPIGMRFGNPTGEFQWNGRVAIVRHHKGGDLNEWPLDLRVREYPA